MAQDVKYKKKQEAKLQNTSSKNEDDASKPVPLRYGPLPKLKGQRIFSRIVVVISVLTYAWFFSPTQNNKKETALALQGYVYQSRGQSVKCDRAYLEDINKYPGCIPKKCARMINDEIVTQSEADILLWFAKRAMSFAKPKGGVTIMDLHSGALTYEDSFINIYKTSEQGFVTTRDLFIYRDVRNKIQKSIALAFNLDVTKLYLTHPTFFSRMTNKEPQNIHDEYWHPHVDKDTYDSFHYTSLLYLSDHNIDFVGGRFIYQDNLQNPKENVTVEPRKGRVSFFTSGAENPHFVERVTEGERYAITISFTCDETKKIADPFDAVQHAHPVH
ncbi:2-oxoglutarate and iron-dependent oxygenase domain-containing protein 3-like [Anthonomus grandis grandis]|uniref:2-oxoglutarate and iron-dependent oxygenase domain-containing protein 3-like n=1 Tax=Anthonomus grandis grandis TaxID=2921223 RepID=UPI0021656DE4|nr:2-oxoglutarate and iron-dependent oxygenase domain-containing protein 3-like [Anthonomus grandis grandis]